MAKSRSSSTGARSGKYKPDYFRSKGVDEDGKVDTYSTIYRTVLMDPVFQNLAPFVQNVYFKCCSQLTDRKARNALYNHIKTNGIVCGTSYEQRTFVFPAKHCEQLGMDKSNVTKALKKLEECGFIETVEKNNHRYKMNVYQFSRKWQD